MNWNYFFCHRASIELLREFQTERRMEAVRRKWQLKKATDRTIAVTDERVSQLEQDVGYLALVLGSILDRLNEKGVVVREDVHRAIQSLDDMDGVRDGKFDVALLRQITSSDAASP